MTNLPIGFRDIKADKALAEQYGGLTISRAVVDGQRGYAVTNGNNIRCFHFSLADALRNIMHQLGHGEDRDLFIMGEPEEGNAW